MITLQKIKYKNFLSTGNNFIEIFLNKSPTTLIVGDNGAGKSTLLDAIYFGLFGKPFRNITKPQLINSINNCDLLVELDLTIANANYKIVRGMKPAIFEIYKNGILINQDSTTKDYQKQLEIEILGGLNERVFKQVVVIGSTDYRPFMQLPAAQRREVIEELLDIKIFSHMLTVAKEKSTIIKDKLKDMDYNIDLLTEKIKLQKNSTKKQNKDRENKITRLSNTITEEQNKILKYQSGIEKIQNKNVKLNQKLIGKDLLDKTMSDLSRAKVTLNNKIGSANKSIDFFKINNNCPTCEQDITENHKQSIINMTIGNIEEFQNDLGKIEEQVNKKMKFVKIYDDLVCKINDFNDNIYKLQTEIQATQRYINTLQTEISQLNEVDSNNENVTLTLLKEQLIDYKNNRIELLEEKQYYDVVIGMLKDGGIKSKIIKQYIPVMNQIINDYLVRFALPIEFTLDEQFNEVIRSRHRDNFQYNNFSEGEKQRINLSLLLAWRQLAQSKNTVNTNLLIFDETFDSSLDSVATEELINILLEMSKTNIFVVSHKNDLEDKLRSTITFEKRNNFTVMKT